MLAILLISLLASGVHSDASAEESDMGRFVSLPKYHEKLEELEGKMLAKLDSTNDDERQQLLSERLEEIAAAGFAPTAFDGEFEEINEHSQLSADFYEGDIILSQEQLEALDVVDPRNISSRARRQAWKPQRFPSNIWGTTPIPYSFDPSYPADGIPVIREAIKFWQDNTCIRFQEGGAGTQRVKFIHGNGCYSYIGRLNQEQPVSIGNGCKWIGTVTHELGHTLGLYHTQSRLDRDRFVFVNKNNIEQGQAHNFDMGPQGELDNFEIPYEYGSNMHYHPYGFARDNKVPTLVAVDKKYQYSMDGRVPTFYDILLINKYYGCFDAMCKGVSVSCQNGGVQDVKNCRSCKCPPGYAGSDCSQIDPKFKKIAATAGNRKEETVSVGDSKKWEMAPKAYEGFYVLEAPAGKRLELIVTKTDVKVVAPNCHYGGMQIWTSKDTRISGVKFCAKEQLEPYYISEGERIFIYVWSLYADVNISFTQRYY